MIRQAWIDSGGAVAVVRQCALAGVSRATVYARRHPKPMNEIDLLLKSTPMDHEIHETHERKPGMNRPIMSGTRHRLQACIAAFLNTTAFVA